MDLPAFSAMIQAMDPNDWCEDALGELNSQVSEANSGLQQQTQPDSKAQAPRRASPRNSVGPRTREEQAMRDRSMRNFYQSRARGMSSAKMQAYLSRVSKHSRESSRKTDRQARAKERQDAQQAHGLETQSAPVGEGRREDRLSEELSRCQIQDVGSEAQKVEEGKSNGSMDVEATQVVKE